MELNVQGDIIDNNSISKISSVKLTDVSKVILTGDYNKDTVVLDCIAHERLVRIRPVKRGKLKICIKGDIDTLICKDTVSVYGNVEQVTARNSISNEGKIGTVEKVGDSIITDETIRVLSEEEQRRERADLELKIQLSYNGLCDDLFKSIEERENEMYSSLQAQYTNIRMENAFKSKPLDLLVVCAVNVDLKVEIFGNVNNLKVDNMALIRGNINHAYAGNCITTHQFHNRVN